MAIFPYKWYLSNGYPSPTIEKHNCTAFGTFVCGGGSTMGYKLAGYKHLGGVEMDDKIAKIYQRNHNPNYLYPEDIRKFNEREDLPDELYQLDLLDGSPPCSTFSSTGLREKAWGKKKMFREGQAKQTLDDLVFAYCDTIIKLRPKCFVLENVKGIIMGNAKSYTKEIVKRLDDAGYRTQVFLLNSASMGIPQKRERVFFIGCRKDLNYPIIRLNFDEPPIVFKRICDYKDLGNDLTPLYQGYWDKAKEGDPVGKFATLRKIKMNDVSNTIVAANGCFSPLSKRKLNRKESCLIGSFPLDYDFMDMDYNYLIGMSVPPVMTAMISYQIYLQWLKK